MQCPGGGAISVVLLHLAMYRCNAQARGGVIPPAGIEPARLAPEASALSTELRGPMIDSTIGI